MFKLVVKSADQIPEGFEDAYEERNGKYHLKLSDEVVPKSQVTEFRDNNIQLMKDKDAIAAQLKQYDGVDLSEYNAAMALKQQADDKKLLNEEGVEKLVEKRVERMRQDFEGQTKALQTKLGTLEEEKGSLTSQLSTVLIDSQIQQAVNEVGKPRQGAMEDIMNRGRSLYKLKDGEPVPIGTDGNPIFGKDGKGTMTFVEWAQGLQETAGYLFETAQGGGSKGNRSGPTTPTKHISSGDAVEFGNNLEDIAAGKVAVQ